ncbi:hypothetical protein GQX73_g963 [Xylaria multiplex]|uniref:Uncharacterized protein n=1 Tax=Xylaria multiplex TaxID=323545 RepID=A0A7C8IUD4_9PEZI|nr:hypothetical protein GQX73_g963 [Xylaria multiplex]
MSNQATRELKPPTPEEINNLRDELHSLKLKGTPNSPDEAAIEEILLLPPSLFYEAIRNLNLAFGPLSTFPVLEHPLATVAAHDISQSRRPNPIIHDGESLLEDALAALDSYNKLLEEKVAKFSIQSARSIATLRESSASEQDTKLLDERVAEIKRRKLLHEKQIAILKKSVDSYDEKRSLRLEEYDRLFYNEILFLKGYETFFDKNYRSASRESSPWSEYDYVLQHIERWRHLVNVDSHESEAAIDRAREHVNQLSLFTQSLVAARSDHRKVVHDEAADIIKEIDWLWEEVVPVAHMSVSAQFLGPVLTRFKNWKDSKNLRETIVMTYVRSTFIACTIHANSKKISGVLRFMNDRLSAVAERTQLLVYHHQALHNVARVRQSIKTSSHIDTAPGHKSQSRNTQRQNQHSTLSDKLQAFMQFYGAIPIHADNLSPTPTPSLLDEYVQNRAHKGDTLLQDLHKLFETAARSGLTDQEHGEELLLESLLADSAASPMQPGSVYKDTQLEGSIDVLRGQVNQIQEMFNDLKLGGPASAPDYVAHAYRQITGQLSTKDGKGYFKGGDSPNSARNACIRGPKFEDFVRKWGC